MLIWVYFSRAVLNDFLSELIHQTGTLSMRLVKFFNGIALSGAKNKSYIVRKMSKFQENDYNLAKNTEFLVRSIFSGFPNFHPVMTNDDALES